MGKLLIGITCLVSSVLILCTGFIISALKSVHDASYANINSFEYNIFSIHFLWFLVPLILFILGCYLSYAGSKDYHEQAR